MRRPSRWTSVSVAVALVLGASLSACDDAGTPVINSIDPEFGPPEALITIEGENLANVEVMRFDGQVVNFNTSYNSDNALLFRVPSNVDPAEYTLSLTTEGGVAEIPFRVALEAPQVFGFSPERGPVGSTTTLYGENFFEPIEVYFPMGMEDSVLAEVVTLADDSVRVRVPVGATQGNMSMVANGGYAPVPGRYKVIERLLIADFDGNGVRSDISQYRFTPGLEQGAADAVQSSNPDPIDGNFLKISGQDAAGTGLIGSVTTQTNDPAEFANFGIRTSPANTILEFDVNTNGHPATVLTLVLKERGGSRNDFIRKLELDEPGWVHISEPLARFTDLNDEPIDPSLLVSVRFLFFDEERTGERYEINVDNLELIEVF